MTHARTLLALLASAALLAACDSEYRNSNRQPSTVIPPTTTGPASETATMPAAPAASQPADPTRPPLGESVTTASGLTYKFTQYGTGPKPQTGDTLVIHGIGSFTDGKEFWNTRTDNRPYNYRLGIDRVIKGFTEGMQFVRQGDRIVITMKPELAYGTRGNRDIPPDSTLIFDYEILSIRPAPPQATRPATSPATQPGGE